MPREGYEGPMKPVRTLARALLSGTFVVGGARTLARPQQAAIAAEPVLDRLTPALRKVAPWAPTDPVTLVRLNAGIHMVGGLMLATGHLPRVAAGAMAATMVPTTVAGHRFWEATDSRERRVQLNHFLKNLGLMGGLLLAAADTEGEPGLGWRARHLAGHASDSTRRTAHSASRATQRAVHGAQREVRTARQEARIAVKAARLGHRLPARASR